MMKIVSDTENDNYNNFFTEDAHINDHDSYNIFFWCVW